MSYFIAATIWYCVVSVTATAPLTPQDAWIVPNGRLGDFAETYYQGDNVTLKWDCCLNNTKDDLWAVSFDWDVVQYSEFVIGKVPLNEEPGGQWTWLISTPDEVLDKTSRFHFQFKPQTQPERFDYSTPELSSTGVRILKKRPHPPGDSSTSLDTTTAVSYITKTATVSTTRTVAGHPTLTDAGDDSQTQGIHATSSGSLSTGAKAGIGVGVSVGVLLVIAVVILLYCRKRNRGGPDGGRAGSYAPMNQKEPAPDTPRSAYLTPPPGEMAYATLPRDIYTSTPSQDEFRATFPRDVLHHPTPPIGIGLTPIRDILDSTPPRSLGYATPPLEVAHSMPVSPSQLHSISSQDLHAEHTRYNSEPAELDNERGTYELE